MDVFDKLRKAEKSPAWDRISAYVIIRKNGEGGIMGKVLVKHPKDGMGPLEVFMWDWTDPEKSAPIQYGRAGGCGYDKLASAMENMVFAEMKFTDHPKHWKSLLNESGYDYFQVI